MTKQHRRSVISVIIAAATLLTTVAHAATSTLYLIRSSLNNVTDTNGGTDLWQYEGGSIQTASGTVIGTYMINRRVTSSATSTYNSAAATETLFFTPSNSSLPPNSITLEGAYSYNSGEFIGSVSAASSKYRWIIGSDAASTVTSSSTQKLVLTWIGSGALYLP